jgi:hypothetical protein
MPAPPDRIAGSVAPSSGAPASEVLDLAATSATTARQTRRANGIGPRLRSARFGGFACKNLTCCSRRIFLRPSRNATTFGEISGLTLDSGFRIGKIYS